MSYIPRTPLRIMRDSVHALFIRELRTRFGGSKLGYFWAIAEPAGQAAIMSALFAVIGRSSLSGVDVAVFMVAGLVPFKLFSKLVSQLSNAVVANKGLMTYRQVEPIDPVITRLVIEFVTALITLVLLMFLMWWFLGYKTMPQKPLEVLYGFSLMAFVGFGLSLPLCVATEYLPDIGRFVGLLMTPMMFISGVFYSASMIPNQYWYLFDWNPVFHCLEIIREGWYPLYSVGFASHEYVLVFCGISVFMGLLLLVAFRSKLVSP